jgi:hypothetical protein
VDQTPALASEKQIDCIPYDLGDFSSDRELRLRNETKSKKKTTNGNRM